MSISGEELRRIAQLARLRLEDDELERLGSELNAILEHIDALRVLALHEASDISPQLSEPLPSARSEEAEEPDALSAGPGDFAPEWRDGFFVVPPPPGVQRSEADQGTTDS